MATRTSYLFIFALIYSAQCNLGQATLCESTQTYPNGATTVCESTHGLGSAGVMPGFPSALGLNGLPCSGLGSTNICENLPNLIGLGGLGGLSGLGGISGLGLNQFSSLYGLPPGPPHCLSNLGVPNLLGVGPVGVPIPSLPAVATGASTVCESTPNMIGVDYLPLTLSLGGLGLRGLGLGLDQAEIPFL